MSKALFLDFDGVTHSVDHGAEFDAKGGITLDREQVFTYLPALAAVLEACPLDVVISSSWRRHFSLEALHVFCEPVSKFIVGTTLDIECDLDDTLPANRYEECEHYARQHGYEDWLMVDDQPEIVFGVLKPTLAQMAHVAITNEHQGLLTPGVLERIAQFCKDGN
jgi:hypothetical protein